jgi:hypothetical protein
MNQYFNQYSLLNHQNIEVVAERVNVFDKQKGLHGKVSYEYNSPHNHHHDDTNSDYSGNERAEGSRSVTSEKN